MGHSNFDSHQHFWQEPAGSRRRFWKLTKEKKEGETNPS